MFSIAHGALSDKNGGSHSEPSGSPSLVVCTPVAVCMGAYASARLSIRTYISRRTSSGHRYCKYLADNLRPVSISKQRRISAIRARKRVRLTLRFHDDIVKTVSMSLKFSITLQKTYAEHG